jgi:hypothetical protein
VVGGLRAAGADPVQRRRVRYADRDHRNQARPPGCGTCSGTARWSARPDGRRACSRGRARARQRRAAAAGFMANALWGNLSDRSRRHHTSGDVGHFDRDSRATAAWGHRRRGPHLQIASSTTARRAGSKPRCSASWGDVDHDAFPDRIAGAGGDPLHLYPTAKPRPTGVDFPSRPTPTARCAGAGTRSAGADVGRSSIASTSGCGK